MSQRPYRRLFHRGGLASALVLLLLGVATAFSVTGFNPISLSVSAGQPPKNIALGYNAQSSGAELVAVWIEDGSGVADDSVLVSRSADKGTSFGAITTLAPPDLARTQVGVGMSGDRVLVGWFQEATNKFYGRFSSDFGTSYQDSKPFFSRAGVAVSNLSLRGSFPVSGAQSGVFGILWQEDADAIRVSSTNFFTGAIADTVTGVPAGGVSVGIAAARTGGVPLNPKFAYNVLTTGLSAGINQMEIFTIAWHELTTVHLTQIRRTNLGESTFIDPTGVRWPDPTDPIDGSLLISAQAGRVFDVDVAVGPTTTAAAGTNNAQINLIWAQETGGETEVFFDRNIFNAAPTTFGNSPSDETTAASTVFTAFGADVMLSTPDGFNAEKVRLLLDPDGTLHAFWTERNTAGTVRRLLHLQTANGGSSWVGTTTRDTQTVYSTTPAIFGGLFDVGYSMSGDDKLHVIVADTPVATQLVRYATSGNLSNPRITAALLTDGDSSGTVSRGDTLALTFSETITIPSGVTLVPSMFSLPVSLDTFGGAGLVIQKTSSHVIRITLGDSPILTIDGTFGSATTSSGSPSGINMAGTDTRIVDGDSNPAVASTPAIDITGTLSLITSSSSSTTSSIAGGGTPDSKRGTDSLCAATRASAGSPVLGFLRTLRELLLGTPIGRLAAFVYYFLS